MTSSHYLQERQERERNISIIGEGRSIASFTIDRGHKNGPEIHEITDTGIINIYNKRTHKLITRLIARPGQIKRYYPQGHAPAAIVKKAHENTQKYHYNY